MATQLPTNTMAQGDERQIHIGHYTLDITIRKRRKPMSGPRPNK